MYTDRNILEDSYYLVEHFPDSMLWEYRFASFNKKLLIKRSNSVLTEREIQEKRFCTPTAGNLRNVLLTSRKPPKYFYQCKSEIKDVNTFE